MRHVNLRWLFPFGLVMSLTMVDVGCAKKAPMAIEDAGPPAPASTPTITELAPLTDDGGGEDAAAEAAAKKWLGPAINPNQQKIAQCCNAMRAQAKTVGLTSPEGFQLNAAATYCDSVVKQVGPQGTAPEFAQIRAMLKSVKLPSACQF
jgi:hypothetical protein